MKAFVQVGCTLWLLAGMMEIAQAQFTELDVGLPGAEFNSGAVAWGDYDNDGYLDIAMTSTTGPPTSSHIYRNHGNGTFTDIAADLEWAASGGIAWGDFHNDGDLDVALNGVDINGKVLSRIYRNNGGGKFTNLETG